MRTHGGGSGASKDRKGGELGLYSRSEDVADDVRQPAEPAQQVVHERAPRAHHCCALLRRPQPHARYYRVLRGTLGVLSGAGG